LDYVWYGNTNAKAQLDKINAFAKNIGAANIKDGYTITGTQTSSGSSNTYYCSFATGMLALTTDTATGLSFFNQC
jgi:hypothetical protein